MSDSQTEPFLKANKAQKNRRKSKAKHINIPNIDALRESAVYVTSTSTPIYSAPNKQFSSSTIIKSDIIILINNIKEPMDWIEVYLPIPGWIDATKHRHSLIPINEHEQTVKHKQHLHEHTLHNEENIEKIKFFFR